MSNQIMTAGTELSAIVPAVWSRKFFEVLKNELPFASLISRDFEGDIQALGNTVSIATIPEFSEATLLAEDAAGDADAVTISQQQLVINKRIYKDFIITNTAMLQSLPFVDQLRDMAVYAVNKKMDAIIAADIVPSASAPDHSIAYTAGTTLALVDILNAKELLDTANVPLSDRHSVLGPAQTNDVFAITGFTSSDFVLAGSPLTSGELTQKLLGFSPHMSNAVGNTSYWFHRSFYAMAVQQGLNIKEYDQGGSGLRATRINVDVLAGFKQLDGKRVVSIS